jgi:hypothetical protein
VAALLGDVLVHPIQLKSVEDVIAGIERPATPVLIAIVSRSESVLEWGATLLSALGFGEECVVQRNPRDAGWCEGLRSCDIVGADVVAARELPDGLRPFVFQVVSSDSLAEIACYARPRSERASSESD